MGQHRTNSGPGTMQIGVQVKNHGPCGSSGTRHLVVSSLLARPEGSEPAYVSAFHPEHVFVPADRGEEPFDVLNQLVHA